MFDFKPLSEKEIASMPHVEFNITAEPLELGITCPTCKQNQKLREICERLNITEETDVSEIAEFLEDSEK